MWGRDRQRLLVFGFYRSDGSRVCIDRESSVIELYGPDKKGPLYAWSRFEDWLTSEFQRFSERFDKSGRVIGDGVILPPVEAGIVVDSPPSKVENRSSSQDAGGTWQNFPVMLYRTRDEIDQAQEEYDFSGPETREWRVIGTEELCGDPLLVHTNLPNSPIYTAAHGMGEWDFIPIAKNLDVFRECASIVDKCLSDLGEPKEAMSAIKAANEGFEIGTDFWAARIDD